MSSPARQLIDALRNGARLAAADFARLLAEMGPEEEAYAREAANALRVAHFGNGIFLRGLVEFTNFCRNDCLYCGIRRSNA